MGMKLEVTSKYSAAEVLQSMLLPFDPFIANYYALRAASVSIVFE
jgi:hypothetical protein